MSILPRSERSDEDLRFVELKGRWSIASGRLVKRKDKDGNILIPQHSLKVLVCECSNHRSVCFISKEESEESFHLMVIYVSAIKRVMMASELVR